MNKIPTIHDLCDDEPDPAKVDGLNLSCMKSKGHGARTHLDLATNKAWRNETDGTVTVWDV